MHLHLQLSVIETVELILQIQPYMSCSSSSCSGDFLLFNAALVLRWCNLGQRDKS